MQGQYIEKRDNREVKQKKEEEKQNPIRKRKSLDEVKNNCIYIMNNPFANFPVVFRQDISNRPRINTTMIEDAIEDERRRLEYTNDVIENYKRHIAEQNNEKKRKIDEACKKVSASLRRMRGKTKKRKKCKSHKKKKISRRGKK